MADKGAPKPLDLKALLDSVEKTRQQLGRMATKIKTAISAYGQLRGGRPGVLRRGDGVTRRTKDCWQKAAELDRQERERHPSEQLTYKQVHTSLAQAKKPVPARWQTFAQYVRAAKRAGP